jgi:hypothetical protein
MNIPGPNGPAARFVSWHTVGSTAGASVVAALAVAAGTEMAAVTAMAARAAMGFRRDSILN